MGNIMGDNRTAEQRDASFQRVLAENKGSLKMANNQEEVNKMFNFNPPAQKLDAAVQLASDPKSSVATKALGFIINTPGMTKDKYNALVSEYRDKGTIKESAIQMGKIASQGAASASASGLAKDTSNVAEEDVAINIGQSSAAPQDQPSGTFKRKARANVYQAGINI